MSAADRLGFWMSCVAAERELLGEPPIDDDQVVLHYMGSGASAIVTWGDLKELADADQKEQDDGR